MDSEKPSSPPRIGQKIRLQFLNTLKSTSILNIVEILFILFLLNIRFRAILVDRFDVLLILLELERFSKI